MRLPGHSRRVRNIHVGCVRLAVTFHVQLERTGVVGHCRSGSWLANSFAPGWACSQRDVLAEYCHPPGFWPNRTSNDSARDGHEAEKPRRSPSEYAITSIGQAVERRSRLPIDTLDAAAPESHAGVIYRWVLQHLPRDQIHNALHYG